MTTVFPRRVRRQVLSSVLVLFSGSLAFAQNSLSLASGSTVQGGTVSLNLNLSAGTSAPSGVQWTLSYSPTDIVSVSLAAGPALTAVSKTLNCASKTGSVTCLASGSNASTIASGVLAVVTATVSSSSTDTLDTLAMSNAVAVAGDGSFDAITATGGSIAVGDTVSALNCQPATVTSGASSTCTVTVSVAAPSGGLTVALSSNNKALTVPASVAVAAGSTTATFAATAGTVTANQSVTVTASLNGTSATAAVTVSPQVTVSSLQCSPSTIASGGSSTCTITLSQAAPAGGSSVALSSNNTAVTVPASATVAAASTTATFTAKGGTVTTNQSATVTASLNGASATAAVTVSAQVTVSSLQCSPSTISSGASSTCTITLSQAAPTGGSSVALSSNNTAVTVPGSVKVAAAATTANFTATSSSSGTTGGAGTLSQTATLTATLNGDSATASLTVTAQATVSALSCTPTSIIANGKSTCALTLTQAAPTGGLSVALSANNSALTVPASVTVAAGSTSATFAATAGSFTSQQTVTITATLSGASVAAQLTLEQASAPISFVQAKAKAVNGSAKSLAVSFGSATKAGDIILVGVDFLTTFSSITDSQGNTFTEVGSQLTTPGNQIHTRLYYAANIAGGSDTVTIKLATATTDLEVYLAEYAGVNQTNPIDAQAGATGRGSAVSSGSATTTAAGDLIFGYCVSDNSCTVGSGFTARSTFNVNLLEDETAGSSGSYAATATANSTWAMQMVALKPASGSTPAVITAPAVSLASARTGSSHVPAGGTTQQAVPVSAPQNTVSGISCTPKLINAGGHATCELRVAGAPASVPVHISSSSSHVQVPTVVMTRPNQASLSFTASADALSPQQSVTLTAAASGDTAAQDTLQLRAATHPVVTAPKKEIGKPGSPIDFTVTAADASEQAVTVAASAVPAGAAFDPAAGRFQWTPGNNQTGTYKVGFTAAGASEQSASAQVTIEVNSGEPALDTVERACSPGAVASVTGSSLANSDVALSDRSGNTLDLAGTKVKVNGQPVPVLMASAESVQFLCPATDPGTPLALVVEAPSGSTNTVNTVMQSAAPWIFPADSPQQNQGMISFDGTAELAMARNASVPAHPAQPGDEVLIRATGLGSPASVSPTTVSVTLGGWIAQVDSINPVAGSAGVFTISVRVPASITPGDAVPVQINVTGPGGAMAPSNTVTMAVEQVRQ